MMTSRRLKAFRFAPESIAQILMGRVEVKPVAEEGLIVERYGYQWETNHAIVICSHSSFPEIEVGRMIPIEEGYPFLQVRI